MAQDAPPLLLLVFCEREAEKGGGGGGENLNRTCRGGGGADAKREVNVRPPLLSCLRHHSLPPLSYGRTPLLALAAGREEKEGREKEGEPGGGIKCLRRRPRPTHPQRSPT